jgi:protein TonB
MALTVCYWPAQEKPVRPQPIFDMIYEAPQASEPAPTLETPQRTEKHVKTNPAPRAPSTQKSVLRAQEAVLAAPVAHHVSTETQTALTSPPASAPAAEAREPDQMATPLETPRPAYPRLARQRGWEGLVVVLVEVSETGAPQKISIKDSSGIEMLDKAALDGVGRWRFKPATKAGRSVQAAIEVPIRFSLNDG